MSDPYITLIFVPLFFSFVSSFFFGKVNNSQYKKAWFQPPGYVFGIVWTALYIMLGFLLYEASKRGDSVVLGLLITTLFLTYIWQYFFNYKKYFKLAIFVIFLTLLFSLEILVELLTNEWNREYRLTYVPFVAWLIFALLLSSQTYKNKIISK